MPLETSVQYSIQKYDHLTADRVMTVNIKSLVFYVIMACFPFYKNMLNFSGWSCSYKNGALSAKFQPGVFNPIVLIAGVNCIWALTFCMENQGIIGKGEKLKQGDWFKLIPRLTLIFQPRSPVKKWLSSKTSLWTMTSGCKDEQN